MSDTDSSTIGEESFVIFADFRNIINFAMMCSKNDLEDTMQNRKHYEELRDSGVDKETTLELIKL